MELLTNISIAFLYSEPKFGSETVSQSYMAENLKVLDQKNEWYHVEQEDGYKAWIPASFVVNKPVDWDGYDLFNPAGQISKILESPDRNSAAIRDVTLLTALPLLKTTAGWVKVLLPDGNQGWLCDRPRSVPTSFDVEALVETAHQFLGIQYTWGGKSPKGFDCSGFVQTCFKLNGMDLPRDSYLQAELGGQVSDEFGDWQVGDLIYFSERPERITHVGISLGEGKFIHASGFVRINSLNPDHSDIFIDKYAMIYTRTMRLV